MDAEQVKIQDADFIQVDGLNVRLAEMDVPEIGVLVARVKIVASNNDSLTFRFAGFFYFRPIGLALDKPKGLLRLDLK